MRASTRGLAVIITTGIAIGLLAPRASSRGSASPGQAEFLKKPTVSVLFDNGNIDAVRNGVLAPTRFTLAKVHWISWIRTYHWNNGRGVAPGTIRIIGPDGQVFGPWKARGVPGQGGVPNAYWEVEAKELLGPGTFTIEDSDPGTWSQNAGSGGAGFVQVGGYFVPGIEPINPEPAAPAPPPMPPPSTPARTAPPPAASVSTPSAPAPFAAGRVLAASTVGPGGGLVLVPGRLSLEFPAGALTGDETVTIRDVPNQPARVQLFQVQRQDGGPLTLASPVRVRLQAASAPAGTRPVPVTHLDGPLFAEAYGGRYDAATGTLTFEVTHFSPLGQITSADVKAAAGSAIGAAIGIYFVTPAGVLTLPGIALVAGLAALTGAATNPVIDAAVFTRANMAAQFGDRFRIRWSSDATSQDHLADNESFSAIVRMPGGEVVAFDDAISFEQRVLMAAADARPRPVAPPTRVKAVRIPKCVVYTAAELFWAQTFYQKAGFATPGGGSDPMPRPMEVLILNDRDNEGLWDGTKLNLNTGTVARLAPIQTEFHLKRQAVIAHEYWHSVFTFARYRSTFDWWNEAQAMAFESEVFPDRNAFVSEQPAAKVAVSLRTGFATTGTQEGDTDWSRRGYQLWPWGKFLLNRGYAKTIDFGRGLLSPSDVSALFADFGMALLAVEHELPDRAPVATPSDSFNRYGYVIQFPEGMDRTQFSTSISTSTGWSSLSLDRMRSPLVIGLGDASTSRVPPEAETIIPRPLSFVLFQANVAPPKPVMALSAARTPPSLVVRRETPEAGEVIVALHPTRKDAKTGRRRLADIAQGVGMTIVPRSWFDWSVTASRTVDLALIRSAGSQSGRNPLWTYFLLPPDDVTATKVSNEARGAAPAAGTISIAEPQVAFTWKHPDLGRGLTPPRVLSGYRIFIQKAPSGPTMVPDVLLPLDEQTAMVPAGRIGPYDRIGLASEDAIMKDSNGDPLRSPVQWFAPGHGSVTVLVSEVNPNNNSPFAEDIVIPIANATVALEFLERGQAVRRTGGTDRNGQVTFDVPLDVPIIVTVGKQTKTVTCTGSSPRQSVGFGGLNIKTVETAPRK